MRQILSLSALAVALVMATPAFAAPATANGVAKGVVLEPLTLTNVRDLDFGTVIGSATAGSVAINADTGARTVAGGVVGVASFPGTNAQFQGAGSPNQVVVLTLAAPTQLVSTSNPVDTVAVTSMSVDNNNSLTRTINASRAFAVGVGGVFAIAANQPNGAYSAQFTLTADYQ